MLLDIPSLKLRPLGFSEKSGTNRLFMLRNVSEALYLHTNPFFPFNPLLNCFVRTEILRLKPLRFKREVCLNSRSGMTPPPVTICISF